jgi:site-specific DNA-methyltransferase (adenine-specific)
MPMKTDRFELLLGDTLERMREIPDGSVDMVLADLPYGTTKCKWDVVIPFAPLWLEYRRIAKPSAAIVLFGSQPFTSGLVMSNVNMFKYQWVWDKCVGRGHLVAKKRPMCRHEDICVFYDKPGSYIPQMVKKLKPETGRAMESSRSVLCGTQTTGIQSKVIRTHSYPHTILRFPMVGKKFGHPTQKPVALMEYLIRTYTNPGEVVLDNTMGSGTTGVACMNTGRRFIGIERDETYFKICEERVSFAANQLSL